MVTFIESALVRSRTVFLMLGLLFISGIYSYKTIPKEDSPDIPIPIAYVGITHEGISPEDAVNLLVKPMEQELRGIEGIDYIEATAYEGGANIIVRFLAGLDIDQSITDVREKVDTAKADLPTESDEPTVKELNVSTFPILTVILSGDFPEHTMKRITEDLKDDLEGISSVLEANVFGTREEQVILEVDLAAAETYGVTMAQVTQVIQNNNKLVAAGSLEVAKGKYSIKVPGLFRTSDDILNLAVLTEGDRVVRVRDLADVKLGFKDTTTIARVNGKRAVTVDISKRTGTNIIETVDEVKTTIAKASEEWPEGIEVSYTGDKSEDTRTMLYDLQNSVIFSVLLVMIVVLSALGPRSSFLVATAIPGSFLMAMTVLYAIGLTTNVVVLFALILSVGMLVDGAIVVTELADKRLREGWHRAEAFSYAAKYMAWPIIASTATTLVAFAPLVFWPGMMGEFMKYLPLTLIFTLSASLLMALVFLPTIGANVGKRPTHFAHDIFEDISGKYGNMLKWALDRPRKVLFMTVCGFITSMFVYGIFGAGVEFFPDIEPKRAMIKAHVKGDFSIAEKDNVMAQITEKLDGIEGVKTIYITTGGSSEESSGDVLGQVTLMMHEHEDKDVTVTEILADASERLSDISGVWMEIEKEKEGPGDGKPISIAVKANSYEVLTPVVQAIRKHLEDVEGTSDVDDTLPDPGIEWALHIDRSEAAKAGTSLSEVGSIIRMATTGFVMGTYRPSDSNDELDITARYAAENRNLSVIDDMTVLTSQGRVPMSHFMERSPQPKVTTIERLDQKNVVYIEANVQKGFLADAIVSGMKAKLADPEIQKQLPKSVEIEFRGEDKDQKESQDFLLKAFAVAIFCMAIILVTQFNSFYQAFIILSAVILSTAGVLLGHIIMGKPFGIVMSGLGVIALAGIVVNNNIVLIDTFNKYVKEMHWHEALIKTGVSRLRPVLLTAVTTIIGLMPMAIKLNVDVTGRAFQYNTPSTQWWDQLSSSIIFGLTFATVLTLIVTPCMIAVGCMRDERKAAKRSENA